MSLALCCLLPLLFLAMPQCPTNPSPPPLAPSISQTNILLRHVIKSILLASSLTKTLGTFKPSLKANSFMPEMWRNVSTSRFHTNKSPLVSKPTRNVPLSDTVKEMHGFNRGVDLEMRFFVLPLLAPKMLIRWESSIKSRSFCF